MRWLGTGQLVPTSQLKAPCKIGRMSTAARPAISCTPQQYLAELNRQNEMAGTLVSGLAATALNWQPDGGKSWSIAQCLQHLAIMNVIYVNALRQAVENNRDQLEPRRNPMEPSGWLTRLFIGYEEPPPKLKLPAPRKILPPSTVTTDVLGEFEGAQKGIADFVREWGDADLGDLRLRDPLFPLHFTADTLLLIMSAHNRRHLWQAENVKKKAGFPA